MNIAILLTCHNRRIKTEACLQSLKLAMSAYEPESEEKVYSEIFLTDDGCTDGTADLARDIFPNANKMHIIHGDGSLFWAGGMRLAWEQAMLRHSFWDYYLLLNDDTVLEEHCFNELFAAESFCEKKYQQKGIISGITCSEDDPLKITYGGNIITNKLNGNSKRLGRSDKPQMVDQTNANILLVPKSVVDRIGIFYDGYKHGRADNDYSMLARRKGIPVLITKEACGFCENDHGNYSEIRDKIINMTQKERSAYFKNPLHCNSDYLLFIRRNMPFRYPVSLLFRMMLTYTPKLYYRINETRGV